MPDERFFITPNVPNIANEPMQKVMDGQAELYVLGYVDYVDKFGRAHRGGYARRLNRSAPPGTNNLIFVTKRGYNYDVDLEEPN